MWVADITYIPLKHRFAYLYLITDAYSRKIVGFHVSDDMKVSSAQNIYLGVVLIILGCTCGLGSMVSQVYSYLRTPTCRQKLTTQHCK